MYKYLISFFTLLIFIVSCFNDRKKDVNKDSVNEIELIKKSDKKSDQAKVNSNNEILINKPSNSKYISPNQLTVDGNQRYFLNDTLYTGYTRKYNGDQIEFEIQFKNGTKNGMSKFWHQNGQLRSMLNFVNGKAKGEFKLWDSNGKLIEQGVN